MADDSLQTEVAARIDPLCQQFEAAWLRGQSPSIDEFAAQADPLDRDVLREELLRLEQALQQRQSSGYDSQASGTTVSR